MKYIILSVLFFSAVNLLAQNKKSKSILVFTKNGKGYVHENIPASIAAFQKMGLENGINVDTTSNAAIFKDENLKQYKAIVFSNTNNDVFDNEAQKVAFMRYIQAGGGFMGIHSASGTERNWKWFKLMLGATFLRHPVYQKFSVHVLAKNHAAVKALASNWQTNDEFYYFKEINPAIKVLTVSNLANITEVDIAKNKKPENYGNQYPSTWCNTFDGGRIFYTALGHNKEDYSNPTYLALLLSGLKWVMQFKKLNYNKATATSSVINEFEFNY
jgi:uncharacterized protein